MKYPKTIIKFEGEMKTFTAQKVRADLMAHGLLEVHWTDSHELTVVHKVGWKKGESK